MTVALNPPEAEVEFRPFPKIARLRREIVVTEKIDGTNAAVRITDEGGVYAQSRKRLIVPGKSTDNHGFAAWVEHHAAALTAVLGPGLHFGEWYGRGIQRGYGIEEDQGHNGKFFALFNTSRWQDEDSHLSLTTLGAVPGLTTVPFLGMASTFDTTFVDKVMTLLERTGSYAEGVGSRHEKAEGVVIYHGQGNVLFKRTFENDDAGKGHGA